MLEGWFSEVRGKCRVGEFSSESMEMLDVLHAYLYLLLLLLVESAQLLCFLLRLLLRLFGRSSLHLLLYFIFSIIIQSLFDLAVIHIATLAFIVGRVRLSKAEPFILVLLCESALFITLVEPNKPIVVTSCVVFLLPSQYFEHTGLLLSWNVLHAMPDWLLCRVNERRSLPHYSNNNNTILHPTSQSTIPHP